MQEKNSHFTAALFRQDGAHGPGAHCDDVSFAADDGRSQRRLKLPATQRHFCLSTSRFRFREKLRRKRLSCRVAISNLSTIASWLMVFELHASVNQLQPAADLPLLWQVRKSLCSSRRHTHAASSRFLNTSHSSWSGEPSNTWSMS